MRGRGNLDLEVGQTAQSAIVSPMIPGRLSIFLACAMTFAFVELPGIAFDLSSLQSLSRIEVVLSTNFGSGKIRGTFQSIDGTIDFTPSKPSLCNGIVHLNSRSLRFGNHRVSFDTHSSDWLDSTRFPQIVFSLFELTELDWKGDKGRGKALGELRIKDCAKPISFPLFIQLLPNQRRNHDGKTGDLLRLNGEFVLPRTDFDLAPNQLLDTVFDEITVRFSLTGTSDASPKSGPGRIFGR